MRDEHALLARRAQNGDLGAEEQLIREYKNVVRQRAHSYFIMGADEEDVIQEGTIGLLKAIHSYDEEKKAGFHTYAEVCINRQIISAIRSAARKKHTPLNTSLSLNKPADPATGQTLEETLPDTIDSNPENLLLAKELSTHISENRDGLFSDFELKVWEDYLSGSSYQEIARSLGRNQKAVYNAMERIRRKITAMLEES